jgi:hypothetical protein
MRTVQSYLQFLGKKALMTATHLGVRLFIAKARWAIDTRSPKRTASCPTTPGL